jgi:hypothetical protein
MILVIALAALPALASAQQPVTVASVASSTLKEQLACAPISLPAPATDGIHVLAGDTPGRIMFGPGDPLIISAGKNQGIQPGQMYFVRRAIHDSFTTASLDFVPHSVHTAGWVTIVDVKDNLAVAQLTHACDGVLVGDYLEPFVEPAAEIPAAQTGDPDYEHPGRIVMADEKRQSGYPGLVMLINRGTEHDVRAGQTVTIYRPTLDGLGPNLVVGGGTIIQANPQTALLRIDTASQAIYIDDQIAVNRITK